MTSGTLTGKPAFRDANVLRWLGAYASSVSGDVVYFLALSWAVTRGAGPAQVGAVLAAAAVPRAVLMLVGGVVADRFGPRRVVIGSDLVRCGAVFAAAALTWSGAVELWLLFALALVFGAVDALFMPAVGALPPRMVATEQLARVQGMRTLAVRVSNAVGPVIAASVLAAGGPAGAFAAAGLLFAVSLVLLLAVRVTPLPSATSGGRTPWEDLRDGLRHLRANRRLASLVGIIGLGEMCFSGPFGIGLVLLTDERGWSASTLGWVLAAFSVGGAASGTLFTAVGRIPRAGLTLACSLALSAALVTAFGRAPVPSTAIA
ncbi:MAG TPA: MFS transporter, partial [Streptomyces sp.]|nr:MFS transporter [Streptomyces sp.]